MNENEKKKKFFFSKSDFSFQFFFFHFISFYQIKSLSNDKNVFFFFFVIDFDFKNIYLIYFKTKTNDLNLICQYQFNHVICQRCVFQNNRCDFVKYSFSEKNKN